MISIKINYNDETSIIFNLEYMMYLKEDEDDGKRSCKATLIDGTEVMIPIDIEGFVSKVYSDEISNRKNTLIEIDDDRHEPMSMPELMKRT